jgi:hypothetical protein
MHTKPFRDLGGEQIAEQVFARRQAPAAGTFDLAAAIHAATSKTTPADNDELGLVDSAASNVLKKLTWANLKATLKTYFDTLYAAVGSGGGAVRGMKITQDNTAVSTSSTIPLDSTIPQNTEGAEYTQIATSYTPTDAASILEIEVFLGMIAGDIGGNHSFALFKDSDANAIACADITPANANYSNQVTIKYRVVAGSTSARTYKLRYGPNAGTTYINRRYDNATVFNNLVHSHMKITEFAP